MGKKSSFKRPADAGSRVFKGLETCLLIIRRSQKSKKIQTSGFQLKPRVSKQTLRILQIRVPKVYIYIYICVFACSVACENRYCHSALGGRAAPLFLFRLNTYAGTCMSIEHIYMRPQGSRGIYKVTLWTPHGLAIRRE